MKQQENVMPIYSIPFNFFHISFSSKFPFFYLYLRSHNSIYTVRFSTPNFSSHVAYITFHFNFQRKKFLRNSEKTTNVCTEMKPLLYFIPTVVTISTTFNSLKFGIKFNYSLFFPRGRFFCCINR